MISFTMSTNKHKNKLFRPELMKEAFKQSFIKLKPATMVKNPVMFTVELGTLVMLGVILYQLFSGIRVKPNLMQSGAVSLQVCLDDRTDKIDKLALAASDHFDVQIEKGLTLLTIRHYDADVLDRLTQGKKVVLRQQTPETVQVLMHS